MDDWWRWWGVEVVDSVKIAHTMPRNAGLFHGGDGGGRGSGGKDDNGDDGDEEIVWNHSERCGERSVAWAAKCDGVRGRPLSAMLKNGR